MAATSSHTLCTLRVNEWVGHFEFGSSLHTSTVVPNYYSVPNLKQRTSSQPVAARQRRQRRIGYRNLSRLRRGAAVTRPWAPLCVVPVRSGQCQWQGSGRSAWSLRLGGAEAACAALGMNNNKKIQKKSYISYMCRYQSELTTLADVS